MPDTLTNNYNFVKPEISGSPDTWGNKLNQNFDAVDTQIKNVSNRAEAAPKRDGTVGFTAPVPGVGPTANEHLATKKYVDDQIKLNLPMGVIVKWAGTIGSIPAGWSLCNGATINGIATPDLRDKFIVGGGGAYTPGATGGAATHNHGGLTGGTALTEAQLASHKHTVVDPGHFHAINDPGHFHAYNAFFQASQTAAGPMNSNGFNSGNNTAPAFTGITILNAVTGITLANAGGGETHDHTIATASSLPPYYALAFICKTSYV